MGKILCLLGFHDWKTIWSGWFGRYQVACQRTGCNKSQFRERENMSNELGRTGYNNESKDF